MKNKKLISVGSVLSVFSFSTVASSVRLANFYTTIKSLMNNSLGNCIP